MNEDVQLAMPEMGANVIVPGPVDGTAKSFHQRLPRRSPLGASMARMSVDPMLKGIDSGDPREQLNHAFEMIAARPADFICFVELTQELIPEQFHAHGSNFTEFNGRMP